MQVDPLARVTGKNYTRGPGLCQAAPHPSHTHSGARRGAGYAAVAST